MKESEFERGFWDIWLGIAFRGIFFITGALAFIKYLIS